jgi:hypothetical protein
VERTRRRESNSSRGEPSPSSLGSRDSWAPERRAARIQAEAEAAGQRIRPAGFGRQRLAGHSPERSDRTGPDLAEREPFVGDKPAAEPAGNTALRSAGVEPGNGLQEPVPALVQVLRPVAAGYCRPVPYWRQRGRGRSCRRRPMHLLHLGPCGSPLHQRTLRY